MYISVYIYREIVTVEHFFFSNFEANKGVQYEPREIIYIYIYTYICIYIYEYIYILPAAGEGVEPSSPGAGVWAPNIDTSDRLSHMYHIYKYVYMYMYTRLVYIYFVTCSSIIYICMTHPHVWRDRCMFLSRLAHTWSEYIYVMYTYVMFDRWPFRSSAESYIYIYIYIYDSFVRVTRLNCMRDMTYLYALPVSFIHVANIDASDHICHVHICHVRRASLIYLTLLIHVCDMTQSYLRHGWFMRTTTYSYVGHDSSIDVSNIDASDYDSCHTYDI